MKRLNAQNDSFEPDSFTGCLSPTLQPMMEVISFLLDVNHNFPNKEILMLRIAEEANFHGFNFVCSQSDVRDSSPPVTGSASLLISPSIGDRSSTLRAFAKEMSLSTSMILRPRVPPRSQHCRFGQSGSCLSSFWLSWILLAYQTRI
jgi:hypothetical protein